MWHFTCNKSLSDKQRTRKRKELSNIINAMLCRHPQLHYYQGYHDVVTVFLMVMGGAEAAFEVAEKASLHFFRECMRPDFGQVQRVCSGCAGSGACACAPTAVRAVFVRRPLSCLRRPDPPPSAGHARPADHHAFAAAGGPGGARLPAGERHSTYTTTHCNTYGGARLPAGESERRSNNPTALKHTAFCLQVRGAAQ